MKKRGVALQRRRGIVLVIVLLVIVVAGIALSESLDVENTLVKQRDEVLLKKTLGDFRLAMEIAVQSNHIRRKKQFTDFEDCFVKSTRNQATQTETLRRFIHLLMREGLLPYLASTTLPESEMDRFIPRDPTVSSIRWNPHATGSQTADSRFWKIKTNLLDNSSFEETESGGNLLAEWEIPSDGSVERVEDYPTILNVVEEDIPRVQDRYSLQNRFGNFLSPGVGYSVRCEAPAP